MNDNLTQIVLDHINDLIKEKFTEALAEAVEYLKNYPNSKSVHVLCGLAAFKINNFEDAIKYFHGALKIEPTMLLPTKIWH